MSPLRTGFAAGAAAYALWGLFPLYWPLLEPAAPVEILAHRVVWSLVLVAAALALAGGFRWVAGLGRRRAGLLALAAALISVNWGTYIYGVNSGHVVETSLGYFVNPLVTVALAVVVLHERLRPRQRLAVAIAAVAVAVLAIDYGRPPWIALVLAFSFAAYGLAKKRAGVDGVRSLAVETALLAPLALGYLVWLGERGSGTFTAEGPAHTALLVGAGVTTAVPLALFGVAAIRIPLASLGLLQYLAPVLQFAIGVLVYREAMPLSRLAGFALVWLALAVFTFDAIRALRDSRGVRPAFVYLLRCADASLYCGWTYDVDGRVAAHAAGRGARYTRSRLPVELVAVFEVPDSAAARREEARIKRLPRAEKLALVASAGDARRAR